MTGNNAGHMRANVKGNRNVKPNSATSLNTQTRASFAGH